MSFSTIKRLGSSKNSSVSECELGNGVRIAVKQFDRRVVSSSLHDKFFLAAELWQSFACPGLVSYRSILPKENQIVMDLMEHCLATRIRENSSDSKYVLFVLRGILYTLNFLHQRRFVHANLKPTNVFIDDEGRIRLSDGFLYSLESPGTLPPPVSQKYLSPEHTSDACGKMSPQTDLYMVGFIALELFAGDRFGRGFQGIGDNATDDDHAWFQWHGSTLPAPDATVFQKSCPKELAAVVAKLVSKSQEDRYMTAEDALRDLQNISLDQKAVGLPVADRPSPKRKASANDILDRPPNGVALVLASGSRAGEMIGTDDMEFAIGLDPDCLLRFSENEYPLLQCRLECQRTPSHGWSISRVRGEGIFVNQRPLEGRTSLRSGDIICLGPRGPDVQFNLQSSGFSIKNLASKYLPAGSAETADSGTGTFAPIPRFSEKANSERPVSMLAAPKSPTLPAPTKPALISKRGETQLANNLNPAPSRPATQKIVAQVSKTQSKGQKQVMKTDSSSSTGMNKSQKNWIILAVGGLVIAIVVFLVPTSDSQPKSKPNANESSKIESESATAGVESDAEKSSNSK
jgi:serine/threonine protein kinase